MNLPFAFYHFRNYKVDDFAATCFSRSEFLLLVPREPLRSYLLWLPMSPGRLSYFGNCLKTVNVVFVSNV